MLEVLDGRYPFPRIAPPYRRGVDEVVEHAGDLSARSSLSAHVEMVTADAETGAPPTLVDNVETIANVARIVARGAAWFRTEGTERSPGTIVCTITGSTVRDGVGEVIMGTPLREAIEEIGGGVRRGRRVKAVISGVSNGVLTEADLDTPLTYEDMAAAGGGLGSGGFIVFDDHVDMTTVAAGVSRFLAVESCGQCTACKQDGLTISTRLAALCRSEATERDLAEIRKRVATVTDGARCFLASQQQVVVGSVLERFPADIAAHLDGRRAAPVEPMLIAELVDIEGGTAVIDEHFAAKQPDWTFDAEDSGQAPADRLDEHRAQRPLAE
jgi:hypothetical protein